MDVPVEKEPQSWSFKANARRYLYQIIFMFHFL